MKKMVAVGLVGLALGLVMPGVFAQAPQAEVQKWEQFCEEHSGPRVAVRNGNVSMARHGKHGGFQLVSSTWSNALVLCYRRPAR